MQPVWCVSKLYRLVTENGKQWTKNRERKTETKFSLLFLALNLLSSASASPPDAVISIQNTGLDITTPTQFDPFSPTGIRYTSTLNIKNFSATDCTDVKLTFTDTVAPNQLQHDVDTITFNITAPGANLSLINNPSGIAIDTVAAAAEVAVKFDLVIPPATTTVPPGDYINSNIKLTLSTAVGGEVDATKTLLIRTFVGTILNINIGGAEYIPGSLSPYTMDFGSLKPGVTRSVNVTTRANVQHSLHISSDYGGKLVGPWPATIHYVDYFVNFDGTMLNLKNATVVALGAKTTLNGSTRILQATILNIGTARAGLYRDVITLTVASEL